MYISTLYYLDRRAEVFRGPAVAFLSFNLGPGIQGGAGLTPAPRTSALSPYGAPLLPLSGRLYLRWPGLESFEDNTVLLAEFQCDAAIADECMLGMLIGAYPLPMRARRSPI